MIPPRGKLIKRTLPVANEQLIGCVIVLIVGAEIAGLTVIVYVSVSICGVQLLLLVTVIVKVTVFPISPAAGV